MPTVDDLFSALQDVNQNLRALLDAVANGFQNVELLSSQMLTEARYANKALYHLSQQSDTIICGVEAISRNTCSLLNEAHRQTGAQLRMAEAVAEIRDIDESTHPGAALDLRRRNEVLKELHECCPPEAVPPECTYSPCPAPEPLEQPPATNGPIP